MSEHLAAKDGTTTSNPPVDPDLPITPGTSTPREPVSPGTRERWRREVTTLPDLQDPPENNEVDDNYWMLRFNEQSRIDNVPTPTAEYTAKVLCGFLRDLHTEYLHVSKNLGRDMLLLQDQIEGLRASAAAQEASAPRGHAARTVLRPHSQQAVGTPHPVRTGYPKGTGASIAGAENSPSPQVQPRTPQAPSWATIAQYSDGKAPAVVTSPTQLARRAAANRSSPTNSTGSLDPPFPRRFQLLVHNIPTGASLEDIHKELSDLNPTIRMYGPPIWLVREPKRAGKLASTIVITVDGKNSDIKEISGFCMVLNTSPAVCARCRAEGHHISSCLPAAVRE